jgi:hypothetical protein
MSQSPNNTNKIAYNMPSAKRFQQTIRLTMEELMRNHGYTRAAASLALVQAMTATLPVDLAEPREDEVRYYG